MATKLTAIIVNQTKNELIMKVGIQHYFARLGSVRLGDEFKIQVDLNWTYQEFVLEDNSDPTKNLHMNSDDCCDFQRIIITEVEGKLHGLKTPRHLNVSSPVGWQSHAGRFGDDHNL